MTSQTTIQRALEHFRSGRLPQALAALRSLVQRRPNDADAVQFLGILLAQSGELKQARHQLERAIALQPRNVGYRNNLGNVLLQLEQHAPAAAQFQHALMIDPQYSLAFLGLATTRGHLGETDAAIAAAERGLALRPNWPEMQIALINAYENLGDLERAIEIGFAALVAHPGHALLISRTLLLLNYSSRSAVEITQEHQRFGALLVPPLSAEAPAVRAPDLANRALRVGFISPDFRTHSVAFFVEPLLRCAPPEVELVVFSLHAAPHDAFNTRLRSLVKEWVEISVVDDAELDRVIRARKIDVLVELSGHTAGNRLAALARKPAPLIVTAIGYPNTTGVAAVDLRLCDARTDPPGSEALATERLLRLDPCFLCYAPPADAPPPSQPDPAAPITFGSFNIVTKISAQTIDLWARVLKAVPKSRLLLKTKSLVDARTRADLSARLAGAGIAAERVELMNATPSLQAHLALYSRIHIALDTFPYQGTTTTCEALWMGVPVVTLLGDRHAARVGASLLEVIGKTELVAASALEFVDICTQLASDPAAIARYRNTLREAMQNSALLDAPNYSARFYSAIRQEFFARAAIHSEAEAA